MKYPVTPIRGLTLKQMLKDLEAKRSGKAGTFGWRGKAKDYPGAANIKRG